MKNLIKASVTIFVASTLGFILWDMYHYSPHTVQMERLSRDLERLKD